MFVFVIVVVAGVGWLTHVKIVVLFVVIFVVVVVTIVVMFVVVDVVGWMPR